jgi:hypothetical protein
MINLLPNTASIQGFRVRTRPAVSQSTVDAASLSLELYNEDRSKPCNSYTASTAFYDSYGFLVVSASLFLTGSEFYNLQINQVDNTGSVIAYLYRGEILPSNIQPTVRNSEPLYSYVSDIPAIRNNEYIIYGD